MVVVPRTVTSVCPYARFDTRCSGASASAAQNALALRPCAAVALPWEGCAVTGLLGTPAGSPILETARRAAEHRAQGGRQQDQRGPPRRSVARDVLPTPAHHRAPARLRPRIRRTAHRIACGPDGAGRLAYRLLPCLACGCSVEEPPRRCPADTRTARLGPDSHRPTGRERTTYVPCPPHGRRRSTGRGNGRCAQGAHPAPVPDAVPAGDVLGHQPRVPASTRTKTAVSARQAVRRRSCGLFAWHSQRLQSAPAPWQSLSVPTTDTDFRLVAAGHVGFPWGESGECPHRWGARGEDRLHNAARN